MSEKETHYLMQLVVCCIPEWDFDIFSTQMKFTTLQNTTGKSNVIVIVSRQFCSIAIFIKFQIADEKTTYIPVLILSGEFVKFTSPQNVWFMPIPKQKVRFSA